MVDGDAEGTEDASGSRELGEGSRNRDDDRASRNRDVRVDERDERNGLGFSLPPISLPEMRFPERIRLAFPIPEPPEKVDKPTRVEVSWVLLVVVLADVLDALVVVWAGPAALSWTRAAVGLLLSVVLVGGPGLLYAWELLATLAGFGVLSLAPTLTALVLARILWSQ